MSDSDDPRGVEGVVDSHAAAAESVDAPMGSSRMPGSAPSPTSTPGVSSEPGAVGVTGEWLYLDRGERRGPVSTTALVDLIRSGAVQRGTRAWSPALAGWTTLGDSELAQHFDTPPPAPLPRVGNAWAWTLVLSPFLAVLTQTLVGEMWVIGTPQESRIHTADLTLVYQEWWVGILLVTAIALADWLYLGRVKHPRPWILWTLVTPAYLYARAGKRGERPVRFALWFASFLTTVFLVGTPHFSR